MSKVYTLSEMVDLALATPKIGVVNCFMLHAVLHALIKRLNIGECSATILARGDKDYPWTEEPPKFTKSGTEIERTEPSVVIKVTPVAQPDENARSQVSLLEKPTAKNTGGTTDKKPSRQERSKQQTPEGDDAAESRGGVPKESSSASKKDSDHQKRKPSTHERTKSKHIASPTTSSTRINDDPQPSRGSPKEPPVASKKEVAGQDSETTKKKPSKSKRGTSQGPSSSRDVDGDGAGAGAGAEAGAGAGAGAEAGAGAGAEAGAGAGAKDPQGLQKKSSARKEQKSQDSAGKKKKTSSKAKPQPQSDEDSNGPAANVDDEGVKERSQKSDQDSDKESPHATSTQDQFGLPFLEKGVSNLCDVRGMVKELCGRMADNEKHIKRLKDKTSEGGKSKLDRLNGKLSNMMKTMGKLENAVFGESSLPKPKDDKELDDLSRKFDQIVEMSNNLEDDVLDKIVPEGSSDEGGKALTRKRSKKDKKQQRKERRSSKREPEKDSSEGSDEKLLPAAAEESPEDIPSPPSPLSSTPSPSTEEVAPLPPPVIPATPPKPLPQAVKVKEKPEALAKYPSQNKQESIEHLQKKVNMVIHLIGNLEKLVKEFTGRERLFEEDKERKSSPEQQLRSPESYDKKTDDEKEKVLELKSEDSKDEQSDHSKQKQGQGSYQVLFGRLKKLEDEMQKLHQVVSSDSSSSSNLTKMVGDFLSTISNSSEAPESEPGPKKGRKEKRDKRKKKKQDEDSSKDLEKKEEDEEGAEEKKEEKVVGEVQHSEVEVEVEVEGEASDVEEESTLKEPQPEEMQDIVIMHDSVPEKLSDLWDQLKGLADALRGVKCNVVSLEKNSKNMAKAMHLLMRGNTNIVDEDFEMIGEMKVVVRKLYSDNNTLNAMVSQDRDILLKLTVTVDNLISNFDDTKFNLSGKMENLRNSLIQKADKQDVDNMVSSVAKKVNVIDYRREMDQLKSDFQDLDDKVKMDVQQLKNDKYDRFEMDIFRIWVECKLSATKKMPQANVGVELYQEDGAILKKQIPFHCLSCDKSLLITPQALITPASLPPSKRNSAIPTNEGDSSRLLKKRTQITQSLLKPVDKVLLEGKDNKLYKGNQIPAHDDTQKVKTPDQVTSRPGKEDPLPPLNGAVPSKSDHGVSRSGSRKKSLSRKQSKDGKLKASDAKSES